MISVPSFGLNVALPFPVCRIAKQRYALKIFDANAASFSCTIERLMQAYNRISISDSKINDKETTTTVSDIADGKQPFEKI